MTNKRLGLLMLIMAITLTTAGCFGGAKDPVRFNGRISGTVVDENNVPIPDVSVMSPTMPRIGITDGKGRYTINDVPDGPHLLNVAKPGYIPGPKTPQTPGSYSVYNGVIVRVTDGRSDSAPPLVMHRAEDTNNTISLESLSPAMGARLDAGKNHTVRVDVTFRAAVPAVVAASIINGDVVLDSQWAAAQPNETKQTFNFDVPVPYTGAPLSLQLLLIDEQTNMPIAHGIYPEAYAIKFDRTIKAPALTVVADGPDGVVFSWSGGFVPAGWTLSIARQTEGLHTVHPQTTLATFDNGNPGMFTDNTVPYGETYLYYVQLHHPQVGGSVISDAVKVTRGERYLTQVAVAGDRTWLTDETGNILYRSSQRGGNGEITVFNTTTNMAQKTIAVPDCAARHLYVTPDGRYLSGSCGQDGLFLIDRQNNDRVTVVPGLRQPMSNYYDPRTDTLYAVATAEPSTYAVFAVDPITGEATAVMNDVSSMAAFWPEQSWLVERHSTLSADPVNFYDLNTMQPQETWHDSAYFLSAPLLPLTVVPPGVLIFGNHLFDADTKQHMENVGRHIVAADPDGKYLVGRRGQNIDILTWDGFSWRTAITVASQRYDAYVALPGNEKLYMMGAGGMQVVDLTHLNL